MRASLLFTAITAVALASGGAQAQAPAKPGLTGYTERLMADFYRADAPGAVVLIARGDHVLYRGARGLADVVAGTSLTPESVFRIGSISKQFAAAGVLKLVEAGTVSLDDPLSKYLSDYPGGDAITVLELLNHTSGVKDYTHIPSWRAGPLERDVSTAQLIASFMDAEPDFAPGTDWAYDNSGYALVAAVIESASGQPWHEYLRRVLFHPLGLTHTGYAADPVFAARQVPGYSLDDGHVVPARRISMTIPSAAGALVSTVDDLLKWNRALHEGRVLHSASYERMVTPVGHAVSAHYGLGIELATVQGQPMFDHSGGIFGFEAMLEYVPGPDISVIVLQNNDSNADYKGPDMLARKLAAAALGQPYPEAIPVAIGIAALMQLEGVYRIDAGSARVLRVVDGQVTAQRTGNPPSPLTPIGSDTFLYADQLTRLSIARDANGAVTGMRVYPDGEPPGTLVPRTREALPTSP